MNEISESPSNTEIALTTQSDDPKPLIKAAKANLKQAKSAVKAAKEAAHLAKKEVKSLKKALSKKK